MGAMATAMDGNASQRNPLMPAAWDDRRDFCRGMDGTYSNALLYLLHGVMKPGEDALSAGHRHCQTAGRKESQP